MLNDDAPPLYEDLGYCFSEFNKGNKQPLENWINQSNDENTVVFRYAALGGHIEVLKWFADTFPEKLQKMKQVDDYTPWQFTALGGHIEVLKWIAGALPEGMQGMDRANDYPAWQFTALGGSTQVLEQLKPLPKELQAMNKVDKYAAWQFAAIKGHIEVLEWLAATFPGEKLQKMNQAYNYAAWRCAALGGQIEVLEWLKGHFPDELQAMNQAYGYKAWHNAALDGRIEVLEFLLEVTPDVSVPLQQAHNTLRELKKDYSSLSLTIRDYRIRLTEEFGYTAMVYPALYGMRQAIAPFMMTCKQPVKAFSQLSHQNAPTELVYQILFYIAGSCHIDKLQLTPQGQNEGILVCQVLVDSISSSINTSGPVKIVNQEEKFPGKENFLKRLLDTKIGMAKAQPEQTR